MADTGRVRGKLWSDGRADGGDGELADWQWNAGNGERPGRAQIRFSATYAEVKALLQTRIMSDGHDYANVSDPEVPAELAPTIVSIEGLTSESPAPNDRTPTRLSAHVPLTRESRRVMRVLSSAPATFIPFTTRLRSSTAATLARAAKDRLPTVSQCRRMAASILRRSLIL